MPDLEFMYETDIRAPAETVWAALTTPEFTSQYFHATHIESTWEPGAPVFYRYDAGGAIAVEGEVIEADPPNKLIITWHVLYDENARDEAPSRVTFSIEQHGDYSRLRIVHDQFPENSVVHAGISEGWPLIIDSLKSLLETGEALPIAS